MQVCFSQSDPQDSLAQSLVAGLGQCRLKTEADAFRVIIRTAGGRY
jgi:hypothetical protein